MKSLLPIFVSTISAVMLFSSAATAFTIDCAVAGCIGGTYTLDIESTGGDSYKATYTIDTTGSFSVGATTLNDIEFKVSTDYSNVSFLSGPTGVLKDGPLNGSGCNGNNGDFICIDLSPELAVGGVYTWEIAFDSTKILAESQQHVGARYTSARHQRGWVISEEPVSAVPEPTAAFLFGVGMLTVGAATRRRELR